MNYPQPHYDYDGPRSDRGNRGNGGNLAASRRMLLVLKDYLANSSFHGLHFIADSNIHWTERLFWLVCCLLSWYGSALLIKASWDAFQHSAISFAAETNFVDWDTDFPSVTVCELDNDDRIDFVRRQYEPPDERNYELDEVYREVTYFHGQANFIKGTCFDYEGNFKNKSNCPTSNFAEIARTYRTPCEEAFGECWWNNKKFNCCDHFLALPTEIGICYSFNSIHTDKSKTPYMNVQSNRKTGPSSVTCEVKIASTVYVLPKHEVPSMNTIDRVKFSNKFGYYIRRWYSIKEVENEPAVRDTSLKQRGCRFPEEGLGTYTKYSYSACLAQCRKEEQIRRCGCASHQTPNIKPEETCDLNGILCLSENYMFLSVLKHKFSHLERLYCPCMLSCEDQELKDTYGTMDEGVNPEVGLIEIGIERLPTVRFKRNVVRGKLDLVVSMGGTCGLLVGASLLSFVELFYYFTLRVCGAGSADDGNTALGDNAATAVVKPQLQTKRADQLQALRVVTMPSVGTLWPGGMEPAKSQFAAQFAATE